ncbi:hypothetical protein FACS189499_09440 [Clostridia bacterium]|nr:hypothetical protein FACS189499_09440 [Clostridia bacterium]
MISAAPCGSGITVLCLNTDFLEDNTAFREVLSKASPARLERITVLKRPRDKRLSLGVSALVNHYLFDLGITETEAGFSYCENGKPFFSNLDLSFSISHSGHYALCAFLYGKTRIGCDIEKIPLDKDIEKLAKRFFSGKEYSAVMSSNDKYAEFTSIWVKKESHFKAFSSTGTNTYADTSVIPKNMSKDIFWQKDFTGSDGSYKIAICCDNISGVVFKEIFI